MVILFFIVYNILILVGIVIILPFVLVFKPSYMKYISERVGRIPAKKGGIWIHAASVGEVKATIPLLKRLSSSGYELILTTVTPAGRKYASTLKVDNLIVSYAPVDSIFATLYAFYRLAPRALIIMETELWPNLILSALINRVNVLSVNARLTEKAFNEYRYIKPVMKFLLKGFKLICVQTTDDKKRFLGLGAVENVIKVTGNIKYSITTEDPPPIVEYIKKVFSNRHIVIAGSTHQGEEYMIVRCLVSLKQISINPLLILAPRHLNRISEVEAIIKQAGLKYKKRSAIEIKNIILPEQDVDILLLDTIGELAHIYSIGDVIFVGGSMVPVGGHNILEVVIHKKPVIYGRYVDTIKEFVDLLNGNGGIMVNNEQELCETIVDLINHTEKRRILGNKAYELVTEKVNTVNKIVEIMQDAGVL